MNSIQLIGRIASDLELKVKQGKEGKEVKWVSFTLAVKRSRATQNLEQDTDFIECMCFGKLAEIVTGYKKKGNMLGVMGELHIDKYKDDNGTRYFTKVMASEIDLILNENRGSQ